MILLVTAALAAATHFRQLPRNITPAERAAVKRIVDDGLKDPGTAQYEWYPVKSSGIYCGRVNAKNSFGGYIGFQPFAVFFNESEGLTEALPTALIGSADTASPLSATIADQCLKAGYRVDRAPQ